MSLAGRQIIPIDLNFHLQNCLEIFDKNSADKTQSKNYKGGKSALPHAKLNWTQTQDHFCLKDRVQIRQSHPLSYHLTGLSIMVK